MGRAISGPRPGEEILNPRTGERLVFRVTAWETGGALARMELFLDPGGAVPAAHVHPLQQERFEVLAGTPRFRVGRRKLSPARGEVVAVPPRTVHRLWNPGHDVAHLRLEFRPALRSEDLLRDAWALARAGRTNRWGIPRDPLLAALLGWTYREEVALRGVPVPVQRGALALTAPIGRTLGRRLPSVERGGRPAG